MQQRPRVRFDDTANPNYEGSSGWPAQPPSAPASPRPPQGLFPPRPVDTKPLVPSHWAPAPLTDAPPRPLAVKKQQRAPQPSSSILRNVERERPVPRVSIVDIAPSSQAEILQSPLPAAQSPFPSPPRQQVSIRRPQATHPSSPRSPAFEDASPAEQTVSRWSHVPMHTPAPPPRAYGSPAPNPFVPYFSDRQPQRSPPLVPMPQYNDEPTSAGARRRQPFLGQDDGDYDETDEEDVDPEYDARNGGPAAMYAGPGRPAHDTWDNTRDPQVRGNSSGSRRRRKSKRRNDLEAREAELEGSDSFESVHYRNPGVPRKRALTWQSEIVDEHDPRVTGKEPNRIDDEKRAQRSFLAGGGGGGGGGDGDEKAAKATSDDGSYHERITFLLRLAKALMRYGAPSHRLESQLAAAARILDIEAQFMHLPNVVIANFGEGDDRATETHFIKAPQGLSLGKLHDVHCVYRQVMHHEIGAVEGTEQLDLLLKTPPVYGLRLRILLAFMCTFLICPLAFHGSIVDALVSGAGGAVLCWLQLHVAQSNALYANVFEISIAILMAFVARGLSSIKSQVFCYEAIASSGVVLILPGYIILCSALELASKNIICGSVRMIYAIIYSLFLGFGLTIGSDLYLLVDADARHRREAATQSFETMLELHGIFKPDNASVTPFSGAFSFSNTTGVDLPDIAEGCFRNPDWPWYLQELPWWTLFILVPVFSFMSSLGNMQPFKTKDLPVMVIISCASYAANTAANYYIFERSDVVSAIGAFVVGVLGNLYSRVFHGTAFTVMVTGVLFLVPSGLSAAGGLAQNYRGQDGDQYSNGLQIGVRMVQVSIGITVGLFGSGLLVYSFGRKKSGGTFAF